MLRSPFRQKDGPVYREVLGQALRAAWQERRFWPLAFFASFLLTGSAYDVIWKAFNTISPPDFSVVATGGISMVTAAQSLRQALSLPGNLLTLASGIQFILVFAILLVAILVFSCIAQGALVYALGAFHRGERLSLAQAIQIGGGAFWPVAALNAVTLTTLWILRSLITLPFSLALETTTHGHWALYLFAFLVFGWISFMVSIVQIFSLQALILQGASLRQAFIRGYALFKKHWVVSIETAGLLFAISFALMIVFVTLYFLLAIPLFAAIISAAVLQSMSLFYGAMTVGIMTFFAGIILTIAFMIQLQYATWTMLYRKLDEGGVVPKLHRLARALAGSYSISP